MLEFIEKYKMTMFQAITIFSKKESILTVLELFDKSILV
jgi:hypothetical protein